MKTILLIITLVASLALSENAFTATHGSAGGAENLQPTPPSKLIIDPSEFADKESLEILLQKLNDSDPFVRVEAVQSLGEIKAVESFVSVCDSLDDENIYVRAYAAEALGKIGRVDISLALLKLLTGLDDPSPYVRAMIVAALGELQDERAVSSVRECLNDEDESVRKMAAWALNNIENPQ